MGLPVRKLFLAATNINDVVPAYLESGDYEPRAERGHHLECDGRGSAPSNFARMLELHGHEHGLDEQARSWDTAFDDDQTRDGHPRGLGRPPDT